MSWQVAIMAASTAFTALSSYQAQKTQAAYGAAGAAVKAQQAADAANMAKLQGAQQEVDRVRKYLEADAFNKNSARYDIGKSPSFLALEKANKQILDTDLGRIRLQAMENERRFLLTGASAEIEGAAFRTMGKNAWVTGVGKLLSGASNIAATTYKPTPSLDATASLDAQNWATNRAAGWDSPVG